MSSEPSRRAQLAASLLVAVLIVGGTVWLVLARLGTDPEYAEERAEDRAEQAEDRRVDAEDARDD